jgi:hypothetical protein
VPASVFVSTQARANLFGTLPEGIVSAPTDEEGKPQMSESIGMTALRSAPIVFGAISLALAGVAIQTSNLFALGGAAWFLVHQLAAFALVVALDLRAMERGKA